MITRRETIYHEEGRVAGEETVYDDGHRDAAAYPKTVAAKFAVSGLAEPPGELEDEILQLVKNRARSLSELQTLTGAAKDFLKAATASLEAKGKVTLKGSEVTVTVRQATEADYALPITPVKGPPPTEVSPHRHPEPPRLPTPNLRPKTPAKSSPLTIEGGDGDDFDWTLPVMETYRRLENAHALASGECVIEAGRMKVLRVTNTSDLGFENVRAEVTLDDGKIAANLAWVHNDAEIADIAPHSSRHVVLAMWTTRHLRPGPSRAGVRQKPRLRRASQQLRAPCKGMGTRHGERYGGIPGRNEGAHVTHPTAVPYPGRGW